MSSPLKSIAILSGNHLCRNPRVLKEAGSLARAGLEVEVLGAWTDPGMRAEDVELLADAPFRFTPVVDSAGAGGAARVRWLLARLLARGMRSARRTFGLESRWQLGPMVGALGRAARARRVDLAIAHSEPALAVAAELQRSGRRVGIDLEDWFSEDLLPEARRSRPGRLIAGLERQLLRHGAHASCTSNAMSAALAEAYDCVAPAAIYNAFPWSERASLDGRLSDRASRHRPSIHWYSQTLGEGRGLEDLMAALPFVRCEAEVHLRGQPAAGFETWLRARVPEGWRDRVFLHGLVPNAELLSRIAEHDIGFAGERSDCRSRDLTVTNKILHYLLAGLAVVASDTTGQREVASQVSEGVLVYPSGDPSALAERLEPLLRSSERLKAAQADSLAAAERTFCWERQESNLLSGVRRSLQLCSRDF